MLDLTIYNEKYFEIKMPTGEIINLRKPTQAIVIKMMSTQKGLAKQSISRLLCL